AVDDLPGAERAARHAARLLVSCQGPSGVTLALYNLAEVLVRRGRLAGVEEAVGRSLADNRRAGNQRGQVYDFELMARLELARGRFHSALQRLADAHALPEAAGNEDLAILRARAHGWLGDTASACQALADVESATSGCLEAEEWPAVWACAGRDEDAASAARGTPWEPLWNALLDGLEPPDEAWKPLLDLEPYRAARVVYDVEHVRPGVAPPVWIVRAIAAFRRAGIFELAGRLEARDGGPWRAFASFLKSSRPLGPAVRELMREIGRADVRCTWTPTEGDDQVWVDGPGGRHRSTEALDAGRLTLESEIADPMLDALFAAICRAIDGHDGRSGHALDDTPSASAPESGSESTVGPSALDAATDGIIGRSEPLIAALERIDRIAKDDFSIAILGESGTGKESAARRIHRISRRGGRFVPVNCAAITDSLIQSELFGHVRGAFTGADRARVGAFEAANHGTLFLDEIGDLSLESQAKLLRVLQEGEVQRVGETETRKIDVRVITATHRDLPGMVEAQTFRQDLYYRLAVASVELPPLRRRGDDIELLASHILKRTDASGLDAEAMAALRAHAWPGNIRELGNVLRVAARFADTGTIGLDHLGLPAAPETAPRQADGGGVSLVGEADDTIAYHQAIEDFRRHLLATALERSGGNRAEAARRLGLTRQTLSYHVRKFGLM
ncbi:MAG: sigma 54-interacting transcriptional regulator, partial [Acidobacteriota bacterium]